MIFGEALMMKTSSLPSGLIFTTRCRRILLLSFTATMLFTKMSSARGSSLAVGETRGLRALTFHPCSFIEIPLCAAAAATWVLHRQTTVYILESPPPVKHAICKQILTVLSLGQCQADRRRSPGSTPGRPLC